MCHVTPKQWPVTVPIRLNSVSVLKSCHVTQNSAALFNCKYINCFNLPSFKLETESAPGSVLSALLEVKTLNVLHLRM